MTLVDKITVVAGIIGFIYLLRVKFKRSIESSEKEVDDALDRLCATITATHENNMKPTQPINAEQWSNAGLPNFFCTQVRRSLL